MAIRLHQTLINSHGVRGVVNAIHPNCGGYISVYFPSLRTHQNYSPSQAARLLRPAR